MNESGDQTQPRSQGHSSLPLLVVGTKTLVAAGHVTTQNLGGRKICWKGGTTGFCSRPNVVEYPPTLRFWMDRWSRDQPQPEVSVPTTKGGREERPWERGWSEPFGLNVTISARCDWSVAISLRHWNLRNLSLHSGILPYKSLETFSACTVISHGSIMLPPHQPRGFARWLVGKNENLQLFL